MNLRQPVVVVLGHVDSGKTSLLDKIRGTGVQAREAGGITQHIGASFFPIETIKTITGPLYERLAKTDEQIPGLLFIDTPGHEVFANLRSRGGSAADIAIVVADVNKGFEPQTIESIDILKKRKVPFVVALNKVDMISGWKGKKKSEISRSRKETTINLGFITEEIKKQDSNVLTLLDEKIYGVVGSLSRMGFNSEAFWRIKEFDKELAIVPISAVSGIGIPELMAVLVGLAQQYMKKRLERRYDYVRGIILEINEELGLGPSANMILLDGTIKQGDTIMVAKRDEIVVTKVKALLLPKPLDEMRDPRDKFRSVTEVISAAGLRIVSPDLEGVLAGSPLYVLRNKDEEKEIRHFIESEVKGTFINNTNALGVILRCDTIGSLEAIIDMLKKENIPIQTADIGHITRRDVLAAHAVKDKDRYLGVILGFNVKVLDDAKKEAAEREVHIFNEKVIYNLVRNYTDWIKYQKEHADSIMFEEIPPICKIQFLKGFVFRRNDPAVFGAEILIGKLRQKNQVINENGSKVGIIHQIQDKGKNIEEARKGMQVAVSIRGPTIGRQINEGDFFYTDLNSRQAKLLSEKFGHRLNEEEKEIFEFILNIKRKSDPAYGYI
ncbi:MAG: translation initiation factor IF-2 [Nitrososphaeraceae archaeon]|nr:translation initiation factor IF-2 [Nitrososphaeraceae archaeon]MDW3610878.1 translation initiation factor IF-2 [Nitrososphaeraceae archaeon]